MAQIFDPLPLENNGNIICCYVNATSQMQVARITNIPNWYFERVVFPGQRLVFETLPEAYLEIHTGMMATAILSDKIPCDHLCIQSQYYSPIPTMGELKAEKNSSKHKLEIVSNKSSEIAENLVLLA